MSNIHFISVFFLFSVHVLYSLPDTTTNAVVEMEPEPLTIQNH